MLMHFGARMLPPTRSSCSAAQKLLVAAPARSSPRCSNLRLLLAPPPPPSTRRPGSRYKAFPPARAVDATIGSRRHSSQAGVGAGHCESQACTCEHRERGAVPNRDHPVTRGQRCVRGPPRLALALAGRAGGTGPRRVLHGASRTRQGGWRCCRVTSLRLGSALAAQMALQRAKCCSVEQSARLVLQLWPTDEPPLPDVLTEEGAENTARLIRYSVKTSLALAAVSATAPLRCAVSRLLEASTSVGQLGSLPCACMLDAAGASDAPLPCDLGNDDKCLRAALACSVSALPS